MLGIFLKLMRTLCGVFLDAVVFLRLNLRSGPALAAENLFLRKQLALYVERQKKPRRATDSIRFTLAQLSGFFDWRDALTIVKPDTLIRWHRKGFRLFWKWKSRPGRPAVPVAVRKLIVEMTVSNPTWGEERIANELLLKVGIQISPRSVSSIYAGHTEASGSPISTLDDVRAKSRQSHPRLRFLHRSDGNIPACVYVFVIMEVGSRRILHFNVTRHPTAEWTLQQFRECLTGEESYRFVIHDRDSIYSGELDSSVKSLGLTVLRTPFRSPQANAFCERLVGSARRKCLDFMIPVDERHIRQILKTWTVHYNQGRPHSSLGPGMPEPSLAKVELRAKRHCIPKNHVVVATSILGGLHHEYKLETIAA